MRFIHEAFPDARFIHIYRNGLEVARSIEKLSKEGSWFGLNDYKWDRLAAYAEKRTAAAGLAGLCEDYYPKGLLEWRLSTEAAVDFLAGLPREDFIELSYRSFNRDPVQVTRNLLRFMGLPEDSAVLSFVRDNISRRSSGLDGSVPSELETTLGGELLRPSMDSQCDSLTALWGA